MFYKYIYNTPAAFSDILLNSDGTYLTGVGFLGGRGINKHHLNCEEKILPIFENTVEWLDIYFSGKDPDFTPKYSVVTSPATWTRPVVVIVSTATRA